MSGINSVVFLGNIIDINDLKKIYEKHNDMPITLKEFSNYIENKNFKNIYKFPKEIYIFDNIPYYGYRLIFNVPCNKHKTREEIINKIYKKEKQISKIITNMKLFIFDYNEN